MSFLQADAQCLGLPHASGDGIYSRFGVMTFADPQGTFTNFRRILRPSGRVGFVCWRALEANELDLMPFQAAGLEAMADQAPFSFADPDYLRAVLSAAGFTRCWCGLATRQCPAAASTRWPRCCCRWGRSVAFSGRTLA